MQDIIYWDTEQDNCWSDSRLIVTDLCSAFSVSLLGERQGKDERLCHSVLDLQNSVISAGQTHLALCTLKTSVGKYQKFDLNHCLFRGNSH